MKKPLQQLVTTAHLSEQMETIILKHAKNMHKIELKQEMVILAKEWMSKSDVLGMDEKFNTWNSELAALAQKHDLRGVKT